MTQAKVAEVPAHSSLVKSGGLGAAGDRCHFVDYSGASESFAIEEGSPEVLKNLGIAGRISKIQEQ